MERGKVISLKQFLARRKARGTAPEPPVEPSLWDGETNQRSLNFWNASFERLNEYLKALQHRRPR